MWKMGCVNGEGQEEDKGEGGQREKGYPNTYEALARY